MLCYVSQPSSVLLEIEVSPKGKGQECMDKVCSKLGIIEQDYFGLQYKGSRGEILWLNLRNRLDRQLVGPVPYRLYLKVKFFVQPHNLIQLTTRNQFYDQVKLELETQKLVVESEEQIKNMVALIAQADHGNYDKRTHQLNLYKMLLNGIAEPTPQMIQDIACVHMQLVGMTKESAQYRLIQEASTLQNYGVEYHEASYGTDTVSVCIGPSGVLLYGNNLEQEHIERLEYPMITKAEHVGKQCVLKVMNDNGIERELVLKMVTQPAANAMYRCITEMHSFFCCDTVHNEVSEQFSRDLKGTLASIFNEKTTLGLDYVFDIKRTSRETVDHARRMLYQQPRTVDGDVQSSHQMTIDKDSSNCDMQTYRLQQKCQALEDTLEHIEDSFACCVCRDAEVSSALCPCGHLTCYDCANLLLECPLCRKHIEHVQKIFLPMHMNHTEDCGSSVSLKTGPSPRHLHSNRRKGEPVMESMDVVEQ